MHRSWHTAWVTVALLVIAGSARALTLTPTEDARMVYMEYPYCAPGGYPPCSPLATTEYPGSLGGHWSSTDLTATQDSDVSGPHMDGQGSAYSQYTGGAAYYARSVFLVGFTLDRDATYSLTGSLSHPVYSDVVMGLCLDRDCASSFYFQEIASGSSMTGLVFDDHGALYAGQQYWLFARAESAGPLASFTFSFDVVPEPELAVLAACVLLVLVHRSGALLTGSAP